MSSDLPAAIDALLPQTQCGLCGHPGCRPYAEAVAAGAAHNRCLPGGESGIARLASLLQRPRLPLAGSEPQAQRACIDESRCIGCTLCIQACPTDAILGANKLMHTVIAQHCTGCELCIPVCPVDCIALVNASGAATGWAAWSPVQAQHARQRYAQRQQRLPDAVPAAPAAPPPDNKKAAIAAALARARAQRI